MKYKQVITQSGGGSLYISRNSLTVQFKDGNMIFSTVIKNSLIEVIYDIYATIQFPIQRLIDDFWFNVYQICVDNDIDWR